MTVFSSYTKKKVINIRPLFDTKVPLALVKRRATNTFSQTIDNGYTYAWAPHMVLIKWTHYQTID